MARNLTVQTPGEAPKPTNTEDQGKPESAVQTGAAGSQNADLTTDANQQAAGGVDLAAMQARLAELEAKTADLEKKNADLTEAAEKKDKEAAERLQADEKAMEENGRMITRADRAKYLTMHSSEVDAKKLLAPVLCKDGWLAPDMSDRPARR